MAMTSFHGRLAEVLYQQNDHCSLFPSSLHCLQCGSLSNEGDLFCYTCNCLAFRPGQSDSVTTKEDPNPAGLAELSAPHECYSPEKKQTSSLPIYDPHQDAFLGQCKGWTCQSADDLKLDCSTTSGTISTISSASTIGSTFHTVSPFDLILSNHSNFPIPSHAQGNSPVGPVGQAPLQTSPTITGLECHTAVDGWDRELPRTPLAADQDSLPRDRWILPRTFDFTFKAPPVEASSFVPDSTTISLPCLDDESPQTESPPQASQFMISQSICQRPWRTHSAPERYGVASRPKRRTNSIETPIDSSCSNNESETHPKSDYPSVSKSSAYFCYDHESPRCFKSRTDLRKHERRHTRASNCEWCVDSFPNIRELRRHHFGKHKELYPIVFQGCPHCDIILSPRRDFLHRHMKNSHLGVSPIVHE